MAIVTTKEMFQKAYEGGYAVGAFNINNMEIIQAITEAAAEEKSPVILQVSAGARKYAKHAYLMALAKAAVEDTGIDLALHLDHGADFEICKSCIDGGFSSVMIDGSHHTFEDNIALTKKVVEYAHANGVVVEGELGVLAGVEDDVVAEHSSYTKPEEVEEFVTKTGVDSLAISIGTSHGAYKFTPAQCTRNEEGILVPPPLRFDILEEIMVKIPGFPIVLHGASSVSQAHVKEINEIGGYYAFGRELVNGNSIYDFDPTKLSVHTRDIGLAGIEVYDILRDEYDIQIEFGDIGNILAYLSIGDRPQELERLVSALAEIQRRFQKDSSGLLSQEYIDPEVVSSPQEAFYAKKRSVPIRESAGMVCSEFVMCYPPGIPILAPGERITKEILDYIEYARVKGCSMTGPEDPQIQHLNVLV